MPNDYSVSALVLSRHDGLLRALKKTGNYQCYGAINVYYTTLLMVATVIFSIKMSTLQLKVTLIGDSNDYAEEMKPNMNKTAPQ